jgi:FAD dependent oxidoreductase TIGR03364
MNDADVDVLVVGGGALGIGHALAALRAGFRVALCERHPAARGASVRNFGMIWPIGQLAGPDLDLALRSRLLWAEAAEEAGFACRATGSLHLAYADDEMAVLREFADRSPLTGFELLGPDEIRRRQPAIVPIDLRGGLFSPHEANVDPPAAIAALHAFLAAQGVAIRCGCPVVDVATGMAVLADGSRLRAHRIVVCSGDDFRSLLPAAFAAADLTRCKLQMLALGPQPPFWRLGPMLAAGLTLQHYRAFADCPTLPRLRNRLRHEHGPSLARGIHVLVSQGDDGRLIVGDSHEYGDDFKPGLEADVERMILDHLERFLCPPSHAVVQRWSGVYALRRGGATVFRAEPLPQVEVVTGVGGSGMTRSLALGEQTIANWREPDGKTT